MKPLFQNTRQQIKAKQKLDTVMNHVREHKDLYITSSACLVAGFLGGALRSRKTMVTVESNPTINVHVYPERISE